MKYINNLKWVCKIILIVFFCTPLLATADSQSQKDKIVVNFMVGNNLYGSMTLGELQEVLKGSKYSEEILSAEAAGRLDIVITPDDVILKEGEAVKAVLTIRWLNGNDEAFKEFTTEVYFEMKKEPYNKWRLLYRNTAEYATPILLLLTILFIIF